MQQYYIDEGLKNNLFDKEILQVDTYEWFVIICFYIKHEETNEILKFDTTHLLPR